MEFFYIADEEVLSEYESYDLMHILEIIESDLNRLSDFEIVGKGADSVVFRYGDIAIKVGVVKSEWLSDGNLVNALNKIGDGHFMFKYGNRIEIPTLYAYSDYIVIMEYVDGETLEDIDDDDDELREVLIEDYAFFVREFGLLLIDLQESNVMIGREGQLVYIDFGYYIELDDIDRDRYVEELDLIGDHEFFEKYSTSVEFN